MNPIGKFSRTQEFIKISGEQISLGTSTVRVINDSQRTIFLWAAFNLFPQKIEIIQSVSELEQQQETSLGVKFTFDKLMPRKANTANALNSIPGPSSRVKTMLVWGRNNTQNLYSIYSSSYQMRTRIIAYLVWPVNSWNYRFPRKYQKTGNIIRFVLVKNRKWNR